MPHRSALFVTEDGCRRKERKEERRKGEERTKNFIVESDYFLTLYCFIGANCKDYPVIHVPYIISTIVRK